jgi:hypothetical protein
MRLEDDFDSNAAQPPSTFNFSLRCLLKQNIIFEMTRALLLLSTKQHLRERVRSGEITHLPVEAFIASYESIPYMTTRSLRLCMVSVRVYPNQESARKFKLKTIRFPAPHG